MYNLSKFVINLKLFGFSKNVTKKLLFNILYFNIINTIVYFNILKVYNRKK